MNETTQSFSFGPKRGARVLVSAPDWQPGSEIVSAVKAAAPTAVVTVRNFRAMISLAQALLSPTSG